MENTKEWKKKKNRKVNNPQKETHKDSGPVGREEMVAWCYSLLPRWLQSIFLQLLFGYEKYKQEGMFFSHDSVDWKQDFWNVFLLMIPVTTEQSSFFLELCKEVFILKQCGSLGDNHWLISYYFRLINTFDPHACCQVKRRKTIYKGL